MPVPRDLLPPEARLGHSGVRPDDGPIVRQVREAEGLLGYSLRARPLTKEFWTLSAWDDARMLTRFIGRPPHARAMVDLRPRMRAFGFHRWSGPADSVPASWEVALARPRLGNHRTRPRRARNASVIVTAPTPTTVS